jgi:hypothetical protein
MRLKIQLLKFRFAFKILKLKKNKSDFFFFGRRTPRSRRLPSGRRKYKFRRHRNHLFANYKVNRVPLASRFPTLGLFPFASVPLRSFVLLPLFFILPNPTSRKKLQNLKASWQHRDFFFLRFYSVFPVSRDRIFFLVGDYNLPRVVASDVR